MLKKRPESGWQWRRRLGIRVNSIALFYPDASEAPNSSSTAVNSATIKPGCPDSVKGAPGPLVLATSRGVRADLSQAEPWCSPAIPVLGSWPMVQPREKQPSELFLAGIRMTPAQVHPHHLEAVVGKLQGHEEPPGAGLRGLVRDRERLRNHQIPQALHRVLHFPIFPRERILSWPWTWVRSGSSPRVSTGGSTDGRSTTRL